MLAIEGSKEPETLIVQLTRMEGTLNLIARLVDDLTPRVTAHDTVIATLSLTTQRLDIEAKSRDEKADATAKALKEARETDIANSANGWAPLTRAFAAISTISTLLAVTASIYAAVKP